MKEKNRKKSERKVALLTVKTNIKAGNWWSSVKQGVQKLNDKLKW